jgi:MFS family permease
MSIVSQAGRPSAARVPSAFSHGGFRIFFITTALAMLADNIEHVISYWVIFRKFHSATLGGFAVLSHWLPFLLFSMYSGALADRLDPRRLIQTAMVLFMGVSVAWGLLFVSGALEQWHARVLLVIHGCAGVLWGPASQLLLHDIVAEEQVTSAVRLNATARYLGMLAGPAVGGALLLVLGPYHAILVNALIYLPMLLWLWKAPYGPAFREGGAPRRSRGVRGLREMLATLRSIRQSPTMLCMTLLAGAAAFFIGNAYQAQMPGYAEDLGHGNPGLSYSMLLAADAAGALVAGFALEQLRLLTATPRSACLLTMVWCAALAGFAATRFYPLALALLFIAGFVELSYNSMAQALVQLSAPVEIRGRVIGVFSMAASGMRTFSGLTVGMLGGLVGIHLSLQLSALALLAGVLYLLTSAPRLQPARAG